MRPPPRCAWCLRLRPELTAATLLLAFWLPGIWQGAYRVDTGLYTAIARYAITDGSWWNLHVGETPYFNKPPLAFWLHGLILRALGTHLWTVRLGSLLAALLATWATVRLLRVLCGWRAALLSGIVLATTVEFFRYTRAFSLDLWLTAFFMLALWCAAVGLRRDSRAWVAAAGVPLGLSLLVKPLLGFLPLACLGIWLLRIRRLRLLAGLAVASILALVIAAPWHLAMVWEHGDAFVRKYFGAETLSRVIGERPADTAEPHVTGPPWYYLRIMVETYWPWLPLLLFALASAVWRVLRLSGSAAGRRVAAGAGHPDRRGRRVAGLLLLLMWGLGWICVLSLASGKSGRYAVCAQPAFAGLIGVWLSDALAGKRPGNSWRRGAIWVVPVILVVAVSVALAGVRVHAPRAPEQRAFLDFLAERSGAPLYVFGGFAAGSSLVYLETGVWPKPISPDEFERGTVPAEALILCPRRRSEECPAGEIVFSQGDFLVVRLGRQ